MSAAETTDEIVAPPRVSRLAAGQPLRGVLLVMLAVLLFACNDVTTKFLVTTHPVPLVAGVRYIIHLLLMVTILGPFRGRQLVTTKRTGLVIVRALCLVAASLFMGFAFQRMPAAESVAIVYIAPLLVVILARPLLGEKIGAIGWIAAATGFGGVLLIVRPGSGLDLVGVAFVLGSVGVTVGYNLLSRVLARTETTLAMLFYSALAGSICFGLAIPWYLTGLAPSLLEIGLFLSLGLTAGFGHFLFTSAFRHAPASLIAPISYMQLIWVGLLGWLVFGQIPDAITALGMAVVAGSGVAIALKSARRS